MRKPPVNPSLPAIGEGKRGEQGYMGYLLRQAAAAHRLRMERILAEQSVTLPQFLVLTMLAAYPGASSADLARLSLLTPQTLSVIIANLLKSNAITRQPHPVHGRIQMLNITPSGQSLLTRCRERVRPYEAALTDGFSDEEEKIIRRWLVAVAVEAQMD
jgi:DNA-binding MarR family transcriptional regulator